MGCFRESGRETLREVKPSPLIQKTHVRKDGMHCAALYSRKRRYRYMLSRRWGKEKGPYLICIGLNPSTAGHIKDDATIRTLIGRGKHHKFEGLIMLNLFAFRATDPKDMRKATNPIGRHNDDVIRAFVATVLEDKEIKHEILVAWGNHGTLLGRSKEVIKLLQPVQGKVKMLTSTLNSCPRHPLYFPISLPSFNFRLEALA